MVGKIIHKSRIFTLTPKEMWEKWTTHHGLKSFIGYDNQIQMEIGGAYEIYFLKNNAPGLRGGEGCKVLSILPDKMLSFTWSAPPEFPKIRNHPHRTYVVLLFNIVDSQSTELQLYHLGWLEGTDWDEVYTYFVEAWDRVYWALEACIE